MSVPHELPGQTVVNCGLSDINSYDEQKKVDFVVPVTSRDSAWVEASLDACYSPIVEHCHNSELSDVVTDLVSIILVMLV